MNDNYLKNDANYIITIKVGDTTLNGDMIIGNPAPDNAVEDESEIENNDSNGSGDNGSSSGSGSDDGSGSGNEGGQGSQGTEV